MVRVSDLLEVGCVVEKKLLGGCGKISTIFVTTKNKRWHVVVPPFLVV